jgi:hypothetical protein
VLKKEEFTSPDIRRIVDVIYQMLDTNNTPNERKVINQINDEELSHIIYESLEETEKLVDREKTLHDCVIRIKRDNMILKKQGLTQLIKQAESQGDDIRLMKLMKQLDSLKGERV